MKKLLLFFILFPFFAYANSYNASIADQDGTVTVNSNFKFTGGFAGALDTYTSAMTLSGNYMVLCNATTGPFDITLPPAADAEDSIYYVKKIDGTHNACNMITNGTETIDDLDDGISLTSPYLSVGFVSDGTNWHTFIRRASGGSIAPTLANYSVIGTFTDWTSVSRLAQKDGDYLRIQETAGNPGYQAWWTFPGVHAPDKVVFEGCIYDGANNDDVEAIIFSHTSSAWHDLRINEVDATPSESDFQHTSFTDEGAPHDRHYDVPSPPSDYVDSDGNVLVGVWHPETGSTAHDWYCDAIHVIDH